jgi:hypothetical protein
MRWKALTVRGKEHETTDWRQMDAISVLALLVCLVVG